VSSFEEDLPKDSVTGCKYAELTATHKALDVAQNLEEPAHLIISADTVVECQGHILEKPADADDAKRMLEILSGSSHQVHTGVALATPAGINSGDGGPQATKMEWAVHSFVETTTVTFDNLSSGEIDAYVASGEPFGKAGSYGIQGMAAPFVKSISGCYFNVVGLPLHRLSKELNTLIDNGTLKLK
jgi:septum formation protein